MSPSGKPVTALAAILAAAAALTACSTGAGSAPTPAQAQSSQAGSSAAPAPASTASLAARAASEKGVVIYGNVPAQYFQPVIDAFTKTYPGIKISVTTLDDNTVFSKYEAEAAQGARTADLLVASAPASWVQAEQNGVAANVTPTGLSAFPAWVNQGHGVYVMSAEPVLLAYSPKKIQPGEVPTTWDQLAADAKADPAKYKLVSYPISNPLDYAGVYGLTHLLGPDKTWADFSSLGPATTTYNEGLDQLTQVIQGGASIGYMVSGLAQGALAQYKGLAAYTFLQDATPLVPRGIAVTAKAASPASAQLFLDFLYSQAGQEALCAGGFEATINDFPSAGGCTASLTALAAKVPPNTTYLVPISEEVLAQQGQITSHWNSAFHR